MTYAFSTTQNNGRIVSSSDAVTGENVSYTYDSLNRLIAAATTNSTGVQWGDSYTYDGFGNLTSKAPINGKGLSVTPQVNSANNQARVLGDYGFDANGNWLGVPESAPLNSIVNTYNVENQLISTGTGDGFGDPLTYTYDPWGKRVLQASASSTYGPTGTLYFYSITGQRLATYQLDYMSGTQISVNIYFGKRLLAPLDRLGSVRGSPNGAIAYYPWGEERTSTANATDKYATYFRDTVINGTGQDYASARYYNNNFGRFWSPDPGGILATDPKNPTTWNEYAYVNADPVNRLDPSGRDPDWTDCGDNWIWDASLSGPCTEDGPGGPGGFVEQPPTPNPTLTNRLVWLAYLRQQLALAAAAILASNLQRASQSPVPSFLQAASECWAPADPTAGSLAYTLEVTYQIEDSTGAPMSGAALAGIFVSETFRGVTGNIGVQSSPGTWTYGSPDGIQPNGTFTDYLSAGGLPIYNLRGSAFQSFNAAGTLSDGIPMIPQPLTVLGFGPATTVLSNTYGPSNVTINGLGLGTNPRTECK